MWEIIIYGNISVFCHLLQQSPGRRFKIRVSFIEIHDDEIRDLLNTSQFKKHLIVIDDLKVSIRNLQGLGEKVSHQSVILAKLYSLIL